MSGLKESSGSRWRVIMAKTEAWGRKARPMTDVTCIPSEKKKWQYACTLFRTKTLKEEAMWHVDSLLDKDCEISDYTTHF
jgi:hypothetical protein